MLTNTLHEINNKNQSEIIHGLKMALASSHLKKVCTMNGQIMKNTRAHVNLPTHKHSNAKSHATTNENEITQTFKFKEKINARRNI